MSIITIMLFFVYSYGLGFSATFFLKNADNFLERNLMRIGIGLGVFSVLGALLNLLHIPIDWKIFLVLSILGPLIFIVKSAITKKLPTFQFTIKKSDIYTIIILVVFAATLFMYLKGSFAYPWLEDDDSWDHAKSIKYVSIEKTAYEPETGLTLPGHGHFHYIDPYPPAYVILMAVLHQTSPSLNWTLKFFNSLLISLGIIFFYFFVKEFTKSSKKALFAAIILAAIPSYQSHFIWSLSLALMLYYPAFYALEMIEKDKKWMYVAAFVIAAIMLTQTTLAFKLGIFVFIFWAVKALLERKLFLHTITSVVIGGIIAFAIWWIPIFLKYKSLSHLLRGLGQSGFGAVFQPVGVGHYFFKDFIFAKSQGIITNPIGIGVSLSILFFITLILMLFYFYNSLSTKEVAGRKMSSFRWLVVSFAISIFLAFLPNQIIKIVPVVFIALIVYLVLRWEVVQKKDVWLLITVLWLIITFLMIHGFRLPVRMDPHRSWMLFAIPFAIFVGHGTTLLLDIVRKTESQFKIKWILSIIIIAVLFFGVWKTSVVQKYTINTAQWGPGGLWTGISQGNAEELRGYLWLTTLPKNTLILPFCGQGDKKVIGFDQLVYSWRGHGAEEYRQLDERINMPMPELSSWLKENNYQYFIIDASCTREDLLGVNKTIGKVNEFASQFQLVHKTDAAFIFKV